MSRALLPAIGVVAGVMTLAWYAGASKEVKGVESFSADSSERCFACGCAGDGKGDNPGGNELIYCELCEDSWCDCCREPSCADKHEWYFCTRNAAESFSAETWWTNCEKCGASTNHNLMLTREDYYVFACSKCNTPKQVAAGDEYLFDNSLSSAESFAAMHNMDAKDIETLYSYVEYLEDKCGNHYEAFIDEGLDPYRTNAESFAAEGKMGKSAWVVVKEWRWPNPLKNHQYETKRDWEAVYLSTAEAKRGFNLSKRTYSGDWKESLSGFAYPEQEQTGYKHLPWGSSVPMTIKWKKVPIRRFGYDTLTHQKERDLTPHQVWQRDMGFSAESFGAEWDGDNLKCRRCREFSDFRYFEDVSLPVYVGEFCSACAKEMQSASDEVGKYLGRYEAGYGLRNRAESFGAEENEMCPSCDKAKIGQDHNRYLVCPLCDWRSDEQVPCRHLNIEITDTDYAGEYEGGVIVYASCEDCGADLQAFGVWEE